MKTTETVPGLITVQSAQGEVLFGIAGEVLLAQAQSLPWFLMAGRLERLAEPHGTLGTFFSMSRK